MDAGLFQLGQFRFFSYLFAGSEKCSTFAAVKLKKKRVVASWALLAVFLPMLLISSLHIHEERVETATACADCMQHSCHGHLMQLSSWSHECVLCQFLTLTFAAAAAVVLVYINKVVRVHFDARQRQVCVAHSGIVGLRAPPAFSI